MYSLVEFKKVFDPLLEKFLKDKLENFNNLTTDDFIKEFVSYSKTLTLASGKRLRPYLAFLMYKAYGGQKENEALGLFISLEVFHMFALVHDDIMDRASTRHGQTAMHKFILDKIEGFGDLNHVANSQAMLVGDLLMSWALGNFKKGNFEHENFSKAQEYFYKMIDEVILGQMLDVDISTKENTDELLINEKTRLKTSRYTCVRPMQIGAALANKNYGDEGFLENLGTKVGVAFQMQDDLLAIIGSNKTLTKDILLDVEEHQHTFFTNYLLEKGTDSQIREFRKYFGKKLSEREKKIVKNLFIESGAISQGKKIINNNLKQAEEFIKKGNLNNEYITSCLDLINLMKNRQN